MRSFTAGLGVLMLIFTLAIVATAVSKDEVWTLPEKIRFGVACTIMISLSLFFIFRWYIIKPDFKYTMHVSSNGVWVDKPEGYMLSIVEGSDPNTIRICTDSDEDYEAAIKLFKGCIADGVNPITEFRKAKGYANPVY